MIGGCAVETISTVSSPPEMPVPDTVAVRSPLVSGASETSDAAKFREAVASPAAKVTVCVRSEASSQASSWAMVTVAASSSAVVPCRVSVKTRSSSPPPIGSYSASMVTVTAASVVSSSSTVTSTVVEPPKILLPDTVAVRSPAVSGSDEKLDALSVSVAVVLPIAKVTVCSRSEVPSQDWSWTMVTVASSSSVVLNRVRVKTRSSIPATILGWFGSMVTDLWGGPLNCINWVSTSLSYPLHLVSEAAMTAD